MDSNQNDEDRSAAFLQEAIALSVENVEVRGGGPFGAVVVKDGVVIGRGWNQVTATNDPTAHAEIVAIRAACRALGTFSLAGCVLYSSCEPCPMCLAACCWARLDRVHFAATQEDAASVGFDDAFLYREFTLPAHERCLPCLPVTGARPEARRAFDAWQDRQDKTAY